MSPGVTTDAEGKIAVTRHIQYNYFPVGKLIIQQEKRFANNFKNETGN